ncbi:Elongator complex protein 5 [Limtongia smithiae]|uniref:Elongator complex protein 5 n=1 Tax=Limtongia smithiae TaxID=1125753 RepID=UPI0034CF7B8A
MQQNRHGRHASLLLDRLLSLKDVSPFILLLDTPEQTAKYLLLEFAHRNAQTAEGVNIVFCSFETHIETTQLSKCENLTFVPCYKLSHAQIAKQVEALLDAYQKSLILIDSLSQVSATALVSFITPLIRPFSTLVAIHNLGNPYSALQAPEAPYCPSPKTQLLYLATTIITVQPLRHDDDEADGLSVLPMTSHSPQCRLELVHRRKSGRAVQNSYDFDYTAHTVTYVPPPALGTASASVAEDEAMLKGLTTFNLGTTEKQKQARNAVELPYLKAQEGGEVVGAVVYEFEKEDDYDEEDPYEDPF